MDCPRCGSAHAAGRPHECVEPIRRVGDKRQPFVADDEAERLEKQIEELPLWIHWNRECAIIYASRMEGHTRRLKASQAAKHKNGIWDNKGKRDRCLAGLIGHKELNRIVTGKLKR